MIRCKIIGAGSIGEPFSACIAGYGMGGSSV